MTLPATAATTAASSAATWGVAGAVPEFRAAKTAEAALWKSPSKATWEELASCSRKKMDTMPASPHLPRRSLGERQLAREQRRQEIEQELLRQMGLSGNSTSSGAMPPESAERRNGGTMVSGDNSHGPAGEGDTFAMVTGAREHAAGVQPCARRARGSCGVVGEPGAGMAGGPSRPPKPRPHRPLTRDDSNTASSPPTTTQRWRSALLPLWPDRLGSPDISPQRPGNSGVADFGALGANERRCNSTSTINATLANATSGDGTFTMAGGCSACLIDSKDLSCTAPASLSPTAATGSSGNGEAQARRQSRHNADPRALETAIASELKTHALPGVPDRTIPSGVKDMASNGVRPFASNCCSSSAGSTTAASSPIASSIASPSILSSVTANENCTQKASDAETTSCLTSVNPSIPRTSRERRDCSGLQSLHSVVAAAAAASARHVEDSHASERTRQLEASARRLRESVQRVRNQSRQPRLYSPAGSLASPRSLSSPPDSTASPPSLQHGEGNAGTLSETTRGLQEIRRRIASLDEINKAEQHRLAEEQRAVEARRKAQEDFEKTVREKTELELQQHFELLAEEAEEREQRRDREQKLLEERTRRRQEQRAQEEERSHRLEAHRREGRTEQAQQAWEQLERDLDRQWAEQEAGERQRAEEYARKRRQQYDEWDRMLIAERHRFASGAEFCKAARHHQARNTARADERFYASQRAAAATSSASQPTPRRWRPATAAASAPPQPPSGAAGLSPPGPPSAPGPDPRTLNPEERAVLRDLQSVRSLPRDAQKAKVKELLFRWHPDKNPTRAEEATRIFQFVQCQREAVLGL
eukprot:CAMPEP_0172692700 /NCGR_PEP_ID=MMETSP1074-20121228/25445_1 /TAXON_ID=2916 /ORGANISM="Ceratium fusus, Strain PA161109" /LENGTH=821 /DNA_ID=CAMNT_0013512963 /DNA_START=92 /DNA_END=2557 /DNA_ORIENTATION=+